MRDGGGLQSTSTASVSVTVIRNTGPIFTNTATYATTVQETTPNGTTVFRPSVRETDTVVSAVVLLKEKENFTNCPTCFFVPLTRTSNNSLRFASLVEE